MHPAFDRRAAVHELVSESKWGPGCHSNGRVPPYTQVQPRRDLVTVALPMRIDHADSLQDTLLQRVSCRFWSEQHVPVDALATMLFQAVAGDRRLWPEANSSDNALSFIVVSWRIAELIDFGPSVWWYDPLSHGIQRVGPAPAPDVAAQSLVLQREFAYASCLVLVVGNLAGSVAQLGAFGHRQLLTRAGAAGNRLLLTAVSLGLVGSPFGGMIAAEVNRTCEIDGYRQRCLFAIAVGYPPAPFLTAGREQVEKTGGR